MCFSFACFCLPLSQSVPEACLLIWISHSEYKNVPMTLNLKQVQYNQTEITANEKSSYARTICLKMFTTFGNVETFLSPVSQNIFWKYFIENSCQLPHTHKTSCMKNLGFFDNKIERSAKINKTSISIISMMLTCFKLLTFLIKINYWSWTTFSSTLLTHVVSIPLPDFPSHEIL